MFETNWRAGMQDVSAAIDETMGEAVNITPVIREPNFQGRPDVARRASAIAVFSWKAEKAFGSQSQRYHNAGKASTEALLETETRKPVFSFSASALPFPLSHGYQIERCCDGNVFEITGVEPDGAARIVVHVVQLGRPSSNE